MKFVIMLSFLIFAVSAFGADYTQTRQLNLDAEGVETLVVDCGAGFLKISGEPGLDRIEVKAEIVIGGVSEKRAMEIVEKSLELSIRKTGNRAKLISNFEHSGGLFSNLFGDKGQGEVNLTVKFPQNLDLRIDDGSGHMEIRDAMGSLNIDDGSGNTIISNIGKDVWIDDGSGDLRIEQVDGNVTIDDGSGTIFIRQVGGTVKIDDGSGSIHIDGVEKDVIIEDSGSGGLDIRNVKGKVYRDDD